MVLKVLLLLCLGLAKTVKGGNDSSLETDEGHVGKINDPIIGASHTTLYLKKARCNLDNDRSIFQTLVEILLLDDRDAMQDLRQTKHSSLKEVDSVGVRSRSAVDNRHMPEKVDTACEIEHTWLTHANVGLVRVRNCESRSSMSRESVETALAVNPCVDTFERDGHMSVDTVYWPVRSDSSSSEDGAYGERLNVQNEGFSTRPRYHTYDANHGYQSSMNTDRYGVRYRKSSSETTETSSSDMMNKFSSGTSHEDEVFSSDLTTSSDDSPDPTSSKHRTSIALDLYKVESGQGVVGKLYSRFRRRNATTGEELDNMFINGIIDTRRDKQYKMPRFIPNDRYLNRQWHLSNTEYGSKFLKAWELSQGGQGRKEDQPRNTIGVIDTSFMRSHPDLKDMWYRNYDEICDNGIDDDNNGLVDDCYGWNFWTDTPDVETAEGEMTGVFVWHGTAVAGAIAANSDNSIGIAGSCPGCRILPAASSLRYSEIVRAMNYLALHGVRIMNFSFGGVRSEVVLKVIGHLSHILFITSAGNSSCDIDTDYACLKMAYPGAASQYLHNILTVGSYNQYGRISSFSNTGRKSVQLFAPGEIISTIRRNDRGAYGEVNGTSFAAPLVAAVAQMMFFEDPTLTPQQVRTIIETSSTKFSYLEGKCSSEGYLNANEALRLTLERKNGIEADQRSSESS